MLRSWAPCYGHQVVAERHRRSRGEVTPARLAFPAIVVRWQGAVTLFDWLVSNEVVETPA